MAYCIKKLRNDAIASNLIPVYSAIQVLLDYLFCKAPNGKRKNFEAHIIIYNLINNVYICLFLEVIQILMHHMTPPNGKGCLTI